MELTPPLSICPLTWIIPYGYYIVLSVSILRVNQDASHKCLINPRISLFFRVHKYVDKGKGFILQYRTD